MGAMGYRMAGAALLLLSLCILPARAHEPGAAHGGGAHGNDAAAMQAQHERMARLEEAARSLTNAVIHGDIQGAREAATRIVDGLKGHEKDVPHKNRGRIAEFHKLHVELGKRAVAVRKALDAKNLPGAAVAYGRVLETCATCHGTFRD